MDNVEYCESAYKAVTDTDAVVLVTEWDVFKELNLQKVKQLMKRLVFIDGRNVFETDKMKEMGFDYYCAGKKS